VTEGGILVLAIVLFLVWVTGKGPGGGRGGRGGSGGGGSGGRRS